MSMDLNQACAILGVDVSASFDEARNMYRLRARLLHPDRHAGSENLEGVAEQAMQELNAAWAFYRESHNAGTKEPESARPESPEKRSGSASSSGVSEPMLKSIQCFSCQRDQLVQQDTVAHTCVGCRKGMRLTTHDKCGRATWVSGLPPPGRVFNYTCGCGKFIDVRLSLGTPAIGSPPRPTVDQRQSQAASRGNKWGIFAGVVVVLYIVGLVTDDGTSAPSTSDGNGETTGFTSTNDDPDPLSFALFISGSPNSETNCDIAFTTLAEQDASMSEADRGQMVDDCVADDQSQYE